MKQLHGAVDEKLISEIEERAIKEVRSLNNFVGILIKKGWATYIKEVTNGS